MRPPDVLIVLPGSPRGKGRPRVRVVTPRRGGSFPTFYNDPQTVSYERALAITAKAAMRGKPLLQGAVRIHINALFRPPSSWTPSKQANALGGLVKPTGKPDFDNIAKIGCDALKNIVWADDAQVVDARVIKSYADKPLLEIGIWAHDEVLV